MAAHPKGNLRDGKMVLVLVMVMLLFRLLV